ncbi:MAG: hypothetical protein ABWY27_01915 [Telluria sp.]
MSARHCVAAAGMAALLSGCLEVKQHPAYIDGAYAGKVDNRSEQVRFHSDKMAWTAAVSNRTLRQNEYNRANP